ncbi:MAG: DUF6691 family protein [Ferrovibrio sp.]
MKLTLQFLIGLIFGFGLLISRLADPAKVYGFLDVAGEWDASLLVTMASAVAVAALGYRIAVNRAQPVCELAFVLPTATSIDRRLVVGSAIFGAGWGLAGICPGPAVVSLGTMAPGIAIFFPCMLVGMLAARMLVARFSSAGVSLAQ